MLNKPTIDDGLPDTTGLVQAQRSTERSEPTVAGTNAAINTDAESPKKTGGFKKGFKTGRQP
ncbi:hypothetical protein [Polluticaenibacter yanchengensis]|uniref:Uncharacterized protein n=1 Tax=Polluticaenibacter yanchengensis TaxID=3014562 RepID=A0ABT4UQ95_9BACT|nr:hypothetical protein [Chitinophagaceae bacterium LY-5]